MINPVIVDIMYNLVWCPSKNRIISDVCTTCHTCQTMKEYSTQFVPPTLKIVSHYPFELMASDLISFPKTSSGYIACLVVVDHYSKWLAVVPIKNKKSSTVIQVFKNQIFPFLPMVPTALLTDNGPEFISNEFSEFLDGCNIVHKRRYNSLLSHQ